MKVTPAFVLALALGTASQSGLALSADERTRAMLALADDSNCLTCHDVKQKLRGPAWVDVAKRYRGDATVRDRLIKKVLEGGGGAWGDDYMSANRRAGQANVTKLVDWILSL